LNQTVKEFSFPKTAVETVADFSEIGGQMLHRNTPMCPTNHRLRIADDSMNPGQQFPCIFRLARNHLEVGKLLAFGSSSNNPFSELRE
jgi:hypothetical protein